MCFARTRTQTQAPLQVSKSPSTTRRTETARLRSPFSNARKVGRHAWQESKRSSGVVPLRKPVVNARPEQICAPFVNMSYDYE